VTFSDVGVNASTGTTETRAEFSNPQQQLRSGQFAKIMLEGGQRLNALTVPQRAVIEGPMGKMVMIVNKDNSGSFQYTLRMNGTTGKVMFRATNSGLTSAEADGNTVLSANTWYSSCGTYDGSNVRVFVNGVEDGTAGTLTGTMPNNGSNLTIGRRDDGSYFPGKIDDVRIYNRALSAAEVFQLYNLGK
jgi:multidrug efflux pump subunit AcrA (membrane-fusion protein)